MENVIMSWERKEMQGAKCQSMDLLGGHPPTKDKTKEKLKLP